MQDEQAKEGAGSEGLAEVSERVDRLNSLFRQIQAARRTTSRSYTGIVIVVLLVMIGYGVLILGVFTGYQEEGKQQALVTELTAAGKPIINDLQQKVTEMVMGDQRGKQGLLALYWEETQKYFTENWGKYEGQFKEEADTFYTNAVVHLEDTVKKKTDEIVSANKQIWRDAFKGVVDVEDDQQMEIVMTNLEKALGEAFYKVFNHRVDDAKKRILEVREKLMQFMPADRREEFDKTLNKLIDEARLEQPGGLFMIEGIKEK